MDESLKKNLLKSIELSGSVEEVVNDIKVIINGELSHVIDKSSGKPRIRPFKAKLFNLILSQPLSLGPLSPFEIRCLSCRNVISYPAWHYELKFDRNIFHYFVCFSEVSSSVVSLNCKKGR